MKKPNHHLQANTSSYFSTRFEIMHGQAPKVSIAINKREHIPFSFLITICCLSWQRPRTAATDIEERRTEVIAKIAKQRLLTEKAIEEQRHAEIRKVFNRIIGNVLSTNGLISVTMNKEGNVEFTADIQNPKSLAVTDEAGGTTYKKLMCMAFDIAILIVYSKASFYRFVYHDGSLETVEDRKRILFIQMVRKVCSEYGLQYIMTLIDSDQPMDKGGNLVPFPDNEICLRLHDRDDSGKLFKRSF